MSDGGGSFFWGEEIKEGFFGTQRRKKKGAEKAAVSRRKREWLVRGNAHTNEREIREGSGSLPVRSCDVVKVAACVRHDQT